MNEVEESVAQAIGAWRAYAAPLPAHEFQEQPGLSIAWGNADLAFYNAIFLTDRLAGSADRAVRFMGERKVPGMLLLCESLASEHLAGGGLPPDLVVSFELTGMASDRLVPPVAPRPLPEYRRTNNSELAAALSDINSHAYGSDVESGRAVMANPLLWGGDTWGYVAFEGDRPVASAATFLIDGRLYVALVATEPDAQRRGYAEGVMRYSLAEASAATGVSRMVLHATAAGRPIYERMGFHDTARFTAYMKTPLSH